MRMQLRSRPEAVAGGGRLRFLLDPFAHVGSGTTRVLLRLMWRIGLLAGLAAAIGAGCLFAWRLTALWGLSSASEPFDTVAFRPPEVPADRDAFALYPRAAARFESVGDDSWRIGINGIVRRGLSSWPIATPDIRSRLIKHGEALGLWRQAADRPEASLRGPEDRDLLVGPAMRSLFLLAQLEASRLETEADLDGAWGWQRACLRMVRHIQDYDPLRRASDTQREVVPTVAANVKRWAKDQRVGASLLRAALNDVLAMDVPTTRGSAALKAEYLAVAAKLADPPATLVRQAWDDICEDGDDGLWYRHLPLFHESRWFVRNEPELSRRVARLVFDNWIASCEQPASIWPVGMSWRPIRDGGMALVLLDCAGPWDTPTESAGLTAADLSKHFDSALLFRRLYNEDLCFKLTAYYSYVLTRRADTAKLILTLAEELYAREHAGKYPASPEELVGPYLKALPEGSIPPHP